MTGEGTHPDSKGRSGFGLAYGTMAVFVIVTVVLGITQFRSFVTSSTETASNEVNALAAAEAGVNWALAELQANASFQTHDLARVTNGDAVLAKTGTVPVLEFESPRRMSSVLDRSSGKLPGGFEVLPTAKGAWKGVVGSGMGGIGRGFAGQFQVAVAPVFLPGEAVPKKVVEAVGRFGKRQVAVRTFVELNAPIVTPPKDPGTTSGTTPGTPVPPGLPGTPGSPGSPGGPGTTTGGWPTPGGPPPNGGPPTTIDIQPPPKPQVPPPVVQSPPAPPKVIPPPIDPTPVKPPVPRNPTPVDLSKVFTPGILRPTTVPGAPPNGWVLQFASSLTNWLLADGEFVDVGMGSPRDPRNTNVFKYGGFYGQNGIQLGHIEPGTTGTSQQFRQFGYFQSPSTVWFKDQFANTTFYDPTQQAQVSGEQTFGPVPMKPGQPDRDLYYRSGGMIRYDKLPLPNLVACMEATIRDPSVRNKIDIGNLQQGIPDDHPGYTGRPFIGPAAFDNPYGNPGPTIHVNFGKPRYFRDVAAGEGDDPINYAACGLPEQDVDPSRVTAFLYARGKNIVVWGCPDRDVIIYTDRDIYVVGDFNQSPWHHQTYTSQVDPSAADRDGRDTRYVDPVRFAIDPQACTQGEPANLDYLDACREGCSSWTPVRRDAPYCKGQWFWGTEERKLAMLVAGSRVWFDYRHPSRFMANELIPWIEYRLLRAMGVPDPDALRAVSYQRMADFSLRAKADMLNLAGPVTPLSPPQADAFIANVLRLPPGPGFDRARMVLGQPPSGNPCVVIPAMAEQLMNILQVEDVTGRTNGGNRAGTFGMAQEYYETVFDAVSDSATLNRVVLPGVDPYLVRFYVPEQTINALVMDGARRNCVWKTDPNSDAKIHDELGNSMKWGNRYLRYRGNDKASPVIGRVFGAVWHLRQNDPNPNLFLKGGVYLPHKRKRVFDRGQSRFIDASLRMGTGGLGGMKNSFTLRNWTALDSGFAYGQPGTVPAAGQQGFSWIDPTAWRY